MRAFGHYPRPFQPHPRNRFRGQTMRVWNISGRGELLRVLRPTIGEGEEGISSPWPCPRTQGLWRVGANRLA